MDLNTIIPEDEEILLATDYVRDIIEGRVEIVKDLEKIAIRNKIVLLKSVTCEGLKLAEKPKAKGLHSLARLISISSKFQNYSEHEDNKLNENEKIGYDQDTLLACLIREDNTPEALVSVFHEDWLLGTMPFTTDACLVMALLAVREGDKLNTGILAKALKVIYVIREKVSVEERLKEWYISKEFADESRAKALQKLDS